MIEVLKASAGSGKTYRLANSYIDLLLASGDRHAYRHILAVTFTNKATAEMKSRILKELKARAATDPGAHEVLVALLHDYSAFAVSTIDKFFQHTLKAFSREIGHFADYQIELDRKSVIGEAMDRILDNLTEDKTDLVQWIKQSAGDQLEQGGKLNLDEALYEMGERLKNQEHSDLRDMYGIDDKAAYAKSRLDDIRTECRTVISSFHDKVLAMAKAVQSSVKSDKAVQFLEPYLKPLRLSDWVEAPKKTLLKECEGSDFAGLFDSAEFKAYNTAHIIDDRIFSLGLAGEFYNEFDTLLKEKNLMCLDESNTILKDIIDGSDAPFVYEKLGVRFDDFLLDEFQDTSNIQWDNFLPLLKESDSRGCRSLIVGDVKQSIYRWRDSDWKLLAEKVKEQFPDCREEPMTCNWRSCRAIVDFNNSFFVEAAEAVGHKTLYGDVRQEVKSTDPQPGCVRVSFCDAADEPGKVVSSIRDAMSRGAGFGDIAVLVRGHSQGNRIAAHLIGEGIPVISDDSLNLKSSVTVRRLVAMLAYHDTPDDSVAGYLARQMSVTFPEGYHSLIDLCESLLRSIRDFDPETFEGETLFVQAFMDDMQTWVRNNGNSLRQYLRHWKDSNLFIASPEDADAVRILTVHKSKGLEFPYLIFPYAEEVGMYKADSHWCHLDASSHGFSEVMDGIYPVNLSSSSVDTCFEDAYVRECDMQAVDNLNIFYVALTRAVKTLHVIARTPSKACCAALKKHKPYKYVNFSEILYGHCGCNDEAMYGKPYDFNAMERKDGGDKPCPFPASFVSIPIGDRLKAADDALDFFSEGGVGTAASARRSGIVLHEILSSVHEPADLHAAVKSAVLDGRLPEDQAAEVEELLEGRIAAHPAWFGGAGNVLEDLNEVEVIDADGTVHRPDRVIVTSSGTTVIDYKFGAESPLYIKQIERYVALYRQMGHADVSGYLWYVPEDKVIEGR